MTTETTSTQFTITREFDAPVQALWRAWTDPAEAAIWWHPRGVATPAESVHIDARVGGHYEYLMITPDGTEYPTAGQILELDEPHRLVMTWAEPGDPVESSPVVAVTLTALGADRTRMDFTLRGIAGEPGDDNVYDGWDSAFDVLVEHLAT